MKAVYVDVKPINLAVEMFACGVCVREQGADESV